MWHIKRGTLETLCEASKEAYPNEFFALMGSTQKNNIVDEYVIIPATLGKGQVLIHLHMAPIDFQTIGSVHSHPSPNNMPSKADLRTFKKTGKIHLIIGYPYSPEDCALFDLNGKKLEWKILE